MVRYEKDGTELKIIEETITEKITRYTREEIEKRKADFEKAMAEIDKELAECDKLGL